MEGEVIGGRGDWTPRDTGLGRPDQSGDARSFSQ